jgi:hypothetical protein
MTRKNNGPKLPVKCKKCEFYDPVAEAYACGVCEVVINRDKKSKGNFSLVASFYEQEILLG